ncbi:MAG: winged helix-turn-helix domain-containing protein [Promethearchaeota archaeon]
MTTPNVFYLDIARKILLIKESIDFFGGSNMVHQYTRRALRRVMRLSENIDEDNAGTQEINYETMIKGTTLDVYFYLLRKKSSAGVREIQRSLDLSSPSVSSYHLDKLETLGIVRKNRFGNYEVAKKIDIGALNQFIMIGNYTLPRFFFYAVFVSVLFIGYIILFLTPPLSTGEVFALIFGIFGVVICWVETILSWQHKPF